MSKDAKKSKDKNTPPAQEPATEPQGPLETPTEPPTEPPAGELVEEPVDEFTQMGMEIANLLRADPTLALAFADLLEKGGGTMDGTTVNTPAAAPAPVVAASAPIAPAPAAPQNFSIPPEFAARLELMEKTLAEQDLDRELSRIGQSYSKMREHFGDVLPESFDEKALLQKVHQILNGKASPLDLAHAMYVLEAATGGEGNMRDRILAAAAQGKLKPPAVEGKGGGIATGETAMPKNAQDIMKIAKAKAQAMFGQSGL